MRARGRRAAFHRPKVAPADDRDDRRGQPPRAACALDLRCFVGRRYQGRSQYILEHRTLWQQAMVLEDEADLLVAESGQLFLFQLKWILAVEANGAAGGRFECADDDKAACSCRFPMGP